MAAAATDDSDLVDDIEGNKASLVSPSGDQRVVALNSLPAGAKEGSYVAGGQIVPPPVDEGAPIRARLAAGDTGGPISLDQPSEPPAEMPPGTGVDSVSGGSPAGGAAPGSADAYIDSVINGTQPSAPGAASAPTGTPAATGAAGETSAIPKLGPGGLPAGSADLQQRILDTTAGEGKALEGVQEAQRQGADEVAKAQADRDELRRQQAADLAAEQQYARERQTKLDQEDAANLQKARDTVIPDFWEGREGDLVGAAITAGLSGFFGGALAGATGGQVPQNQVVQAIQHNIDAYSQKQKGKVDNLYKYAEQKGLMNDKLRSQYAGELTDLMQQHAYLMQSAADRVQEVSDQAKGLVDQAQTNYIKSQLQGKATDLLAKAREIDTKNYDSQTHREIADADMVRAQGIANRHKGGGGGSAGGSDWLAAMQAAAQEPGATQASVMDAAIKAGYRGKTNQLGTMAAKEVLNVGTQVGGVEKQMADFEKQLNGSGAKLGPAAQLSRLNAMGDNLKKAFASKNPDAIKGAVTDITEEAGGMLSGGKTTAYTGKLLHDLQSLKDEFTAKLSKITGDPTEGAGYVRRLGALLTGVAGEKKSEINDIRNEAVNQTLGPGGTANSPAAKRHALARFKGITGGVKDENGNPMFEEGGAKASGTGTAEGATSTTASGIPIVFRGGKWVRK